MGFWSKVAGLFSKRALQLPEGLSLRDGIVVPVGYGTAPKRGTKELIQAYNEQPWLRAVCDRIGRGVASVCWKVYARAAEPDDTRQATLAWRTDRSGRYRDVAIAPSWRWGVDRGVVDRALYNGSARSRAAHRRELARAGLLREISDHPMLAVLEHPNPFYTGAQAFQLTQTYLEIKGEAFWLLSFGADGMPNGFIVLPPHWVTEIPTEQRPWFTVRIGQLTVQVKPEAVLWLRHLDPSNPFGRGTGVAETLGDELETDEYAAKYLKHWFINNAMPSFIVSFEGADKAELQRAKELWEKDHRGPNSAHRGHFAAGKMNYAKLDTSFRDQQLIDVRKHQRDTSIQVFGFPPEVLGIIENSNRSTIGAAQFIYAIGVEVPRAEFLESELRWQFAAKWDPALVLCAEVPIPEDEERRLEVMKAQPTVFLSNEWRGEAGYEPLPELEGQFPAAMPGQKGGDPAEDEPDEEPAEKPEPAPAEDDDERGRRDPEWVRWGPLGGLHS